MRSARVQFSRFARFNVVGLLGAALQLLLVWVLTKCFHLLAVVATPVAVEITVLHNFLWHECFTWGDRGPEGMRQAMVRLWRFHLGNGMVSVVGNTVLIYWLAERLNFPVLPSALAAIVLCSVVNFLVADRWVFGIRTEPHHRAACHRKFTWYEAAPVHSRLLAAAPRSRPEPAGRQSPRRSR